MYFSTSRTNPNYQHLFTMGKLIWKDKFKSLRMNKVMSNDFFVMLILLMLFWSYFEKHSCKSILKRWFLFILPFKTWIKPLIIYSLVGETFKVIFKTYWKDQSCKLFIILFTRLIAHLLKLNLQSSGLFTTVTIQLYCVLKWDLLVNENAKLKSLVKKCTQSNEQKK